jgi:hypothetical protein
MTKAATKPPEPQRLRALERANAIRLARAELKRRIADGEITAAQIILDCPGEAERWTVAELLMSQRRWGSARCRKFLERNSISEIKLIGGLTERQRRLLALQLRDRSPLTPELGSTPDRERGRSPLTPELGSTPERERDPSPLTPELDLTSEREREYSYSYA